MTTYDDLTRMSRRQLDAVLRRGHPVRPEALADTEFHGTSLGLPSAIDRIAWKKFKKVFRREEDGHLRGWNVRAVQNALDEPWLDDTRKGGRDTYGHYAVHPAGEYEALAQPYRRGLMIDYGRGGNRSLDPMQRIRDPLVAVNEGDDTLLLGVSFLDAGAAGWWLLPTWFSLTRGGPLTYDASPPASTRS